MAYFSQKNGYRKAMIQKTDKITIEMYRLLFDCCEKYFKNIAWKYPAECPDGRGCCGIDEGKLVNDLLFEIPDLYGVNTYSTLGWFKKRPTRATGIFDDEDDQYDQYALLDFIEFIAKNCRDIVRQVHHGYYEHDDLSFGNTNLVMYDFIEDINQIFQKTGLLYCLNQDGEVERVSENGVLNEEIESHISKIKEKGICDLLNEAIALYRNPRPEAHKDAVEKIWDALERLKTYYKGMDKKASASKIVNDVAGGQADFVTLFNTEFKALTDIGNQFRIRHHETDKIDITDMHHYDYFFNRCLSLIALAIQYLQ